MKTTIWTAWDTSRPTINADRKETGEPRCIWRGELPHLFRKGDQIVVLDGYAVATIAHVYYSIPDGDQEIGLTTCDASREYPTVPARI